MASDNFNRANSGNLGANWTKLSGFSDMGITSNAAVGTSTNNVDCYTASGAMPLDQTSQVDATLNGTGSDGGPTVRSDTNSTFYLCDMAASANPIVYKCISSSFTSISSNFGTTWVSGDTGFIQVVGTSITYKRNGAFATTFTDSAIDGSTVGGPYPGIFMFSTLDSYDNWTGGGFGPSINTQPDNQTVWEGQTATFSVTATASSGALSYQWQKNGSDILGATSSSYTTPVLAFSDNGELFRCNVTDAGGTVTTNSALLTVYMAGAPCWITA